MAWMAGRCDESRGGWDKNKAGGEGGRALQKCSKLTRSPGGSPNVYMMGMCED